MSMSEWAKREVEIACKRENPDYRPGEFDYGCSCYESALKAYMSLMEDEHSGMSFSFTAGILKRLLESKPLTQIDDVPEAWGPGSTYGDDGVTHYQCKRMSSLFKDVYPDGTVKYNDVGRYYCVEAGSGITYHCGLESRLVDEMYPITMPYYPPLGHYVVTTRELLTDRKHGDFDTKAVLSIKTPEGVVEPVNRYFAEGGKAWREISFEEWCEREAADRYRREKEDAK